MASGRKNILIVEDSRNIRLLVRYNLEQEGYDVLEAQDGREAVSVLQRATPDLILLDLRIPELDGLKLLELLQRYPRSAAIPVIVMTALGDDRDIDAALGLGVLDYLVKPLDPQVLIAKVTSVLSGRVVAATPHRSDRNRRQFVRCSILDIPLTPRPGGTGLDLAENGLAWRCVTEAAPQPGDLVIIEAPALFDEIGLREDILRSRVISVSPIGRRFVRVGATLVGLSGATRDQIRRYVFEREARNKIGRPR